jgi:endonuclease/exonuclease/phosphatase family metal-dependent hydrolase
MQTLRVASYNIRKAIGQDARRDPQRILEIVAGFGVDVVALQEADYRFKQRQAIFDPEAIRATTGLVAVPMDHGHNGLGWHGNILLADPRLAIVDARPILLPGLEPRGAVRADFMVDGAPLRVVAGHLGLLAIHRRRQADVLLAAAGLDDGFATIVMGDFNGWGRARYSLEPLEQALHEARCGNSFPSNRPVTRLDRIYYRGPLELVECDVIRSPATRIASDHLPVRAAFALNEAAKAPERIARPSRASVARRALRRLRRSWAERRREAARKREAKDR